MEKIRIQNLRSILDSNSLDLNNLNIFLGANSTGKSSILRFFALIKQTISKRNNAPILWYDLQGVDFGSFEESVNNSNKESGITFSFSFELNSDLSEYRESKFLLAHAFTKKYSKKYDPFEVYYSQRFFSRSDNIISNKVTVTLNVKNNMFNKIDIDFGNCFLGINLDDQIFQINEKEYPLSGLDVVMDDFSLLPTFVYKGNKTIKLSEHLANEFIDLLFTDINIKIKDETKLEILQQIEFECTQHEFFDKYIFNNRVPVTLKRKFEDKGSKEDLYNYYCGLYVSDFITNINKYISDYFSKVTYIAPVRASAERYYRIQGLSIDEVDSMGANVPMMIYSMKDTPQYDLWKEWTLENFGIEYTVKQSEGHSAIFVKAEDETFNLADTGFGYSQLLPVLLVLWKEEFKKINGIDNDSFNPFNEPLRQEIPKTIVIEQPELHLHPAMQARIGDLLMKIISSNKNINFVIETHSVALINRIGEIIEYSNMSQNDDSMVGLEEKVNLFLVNPSNNQPNNILKTNYDEEGIISKWPVGFLSGGFL